MSFFDPTNIFVVTGQRSFLTFHRKDLLVCEERHCFMEEKEANEAQWSILASVDQQRPKQNFYIVVAVGGHDLRVDVVNLRKTSSDLCSATLSMNRAVLF